MCCYNLRICGSHLLYNTGYKVSANISFISVRSYVHSVISYWNLFQLAWRSKLSWTAICIHTSDITWGRSEVLFIPSFWNLIRAWQLKQWQKPLESQWISLICKWIQFHRLNFGLVLIHEKVLKSCVRQLVAFILFQGAITFHCSREASL